MENYLYFAEAVVETGGDLSSEALCIPASSYLAADPVSATTTAFYFRGGLSSDEAAHKVVLTHTSAKNKDVIRGVLRCVNATPHSGGFVVVADAETGTATTKSSNFNKCLDGLVTAVAITQNVAGFDQAISGGTAKSTSYGAGAISTEAAPQIYQYQSKGEIITKIYLDLTLMACKGDAANDVIGLAAGGAAYIFKYVVAEVGTLYKWEAACTEVPGQGTATITTDIDFAFNASAVLAYDGAAGTSEVNTGGFAAVGAGAIVANTAGAAVPADYIYLVEGDSAATTGVYNAGKLIVKMYGSTASF